MTGFFNKCPKCEFIYANENKWFCDKDNTKLVEVLIRDGVLV